MKSRLTLLYPAALIGFFSQSLAEDWFALAEATEEPGYALRIEHLNPDSQLKQLGLEVGDYIYQVGDYGVRTAIRRRREGSQILYYCKAGGKKGTVIITPRSVGAVAMPVFRPQLDYLRGEIGRRDPQWDKATVAALALLATDPADGEKAWEDAKAAGYPDDELDAFVRAYCAAKLGREIPIRKAFEAVDGEFATMPQIYFANLEDMAYASGQTDLIRRLHEIDPGASSIRESFLERWEQFDASPVGPERLLERAIAARGRDLTPELTLVLRGDDEKNRKHDAFVLQVLQESGHLNAKPGYFRTCNAKLPEGESDYHLSATFILAVDEFHEKWTANLRFGAFAEKAKEPEKEEGKAAFGTLSHFRLTADRKSRLTRLDYYAGGDATRHEHFLPGREILLKSELGPDNNGRKPELFQVDLVRLGNEAAIYLDGEALAHLPVDEALPTAFLGFSISGIHVRFSRFHVWGLKPEETP